jgi:hypothetical protein
MGKHFPSCLVHYTLIRGADALVSDGDELSTLWMPWEYVKAGAQKSSP